MRVVLHRNTTLKTIKKGSTQCRLPYSSLLGSGPLIERQYVSTLVICYNSRGDVSTLVRWYTRDMQSFKRPQYVGTQVIHACSRSVVSTLVRWYASDMQSFNRTLVLKDAVHSSEKWSQYASYMQSSDRTLVHKDACHSWLSEKWSQYASTLVHKRHAVL